VTGCIVAIAVAAALPSLARAADAETNLAERYVPVTRIVNQEDPCAHGEAYQPTDVNLVLGNPDVALRGPWDRTNIIKVGPTAADLARGLFDYHLDFPGRAVSPGCVYDEWSHRINKGHGAHAYARVVNDSTYPGQLALQYWLFYVFNDFNDKHEGDWELIQLNFDAARPGRTRSCNGRSRSSGRPASGATRASPSQWEPRSARRPPTSSAAPSQPDRASSRRSSAIRRRSRSRLPCSSR
jgi:hypothetical protein